MATAASALCSLPSSLCLLALGLWGFRGELESGEQVLGLRGLQWPRAQSSSMSQVQEFVWLTHWKFRQP